MGICINGKHVLPKSNKGIVTSIFPDFCCSDEARTILVPYYIIAFCGDAVGETVTLYGNSIPPTGTTTTTTVPAVSTKVNYSPGDAALTKASRIHPVYGNEDGVGGGLISKVNSNRGWCRPIDNAPTVRAEGHEVLVHGCLFAMNCNGPEGPANTIGIATFMFGFSSDFGDFLKQQMVDDSEGARLKMTIWGPLMNYVPPDDVIQQYNEWLKKKWEKEQDNLPSAIMRRLPGLPDPKPPEIHFQRPEKGSGRTNFDFYPIQVDELPPGMSPQELLHKLRYDTDELHTRGHVHFEKYPADPYGKLVSISLTISASWNAGARGSVLASDIVGDDESGYFIFSTVHTPHDKSHQVHGNREFGYSRNRDGTYTFYISAVDRSHDWAARSGMGIGDLLPLLPSSPEQQDAYSQGHFLWLSMQQGLSDFINKEGGSARYNPNDVISKRFDIDYGC